MAASTSLLHNAPAIESSGSALCSGRLVAVEDTGMLCVAVPGQGQVRAAWLESGSNIGFELAIGDELLLSLNAHPSFAVALGRIGRFRPTAQEPSLVIEAQQQIQLKVGESTLEMHANGQVLVRGEDVVLRAKGTQRIRAGTVAIN